MDVLGALGLVEDPEHDDEAGEALGDSNLGDKAFLVDDDVADYRLLELAGQNVQQLPQREQGCVEH